MHCQSGAVSAAFSDAGAQLSGSSGRISCNEFLLQYAIAFYGLRQELCIDPVQLSGSCGRMTHNAYSDKRAIPRSDSFQLFSLFINGMAIRLLWLHYLHYMSVLIRDLSQGVATCMGLQGPRSAHKDYRKR